MTRAQERTMTTMKKTMTRAQERTMKRTMTRAALAPSCTFQRYCPDAACFSEIRSVRPNEISDRRIVKREHLR